jgi:hypothetical protein
MNVFARITASVTFILFQGMFLATVWAQTNGSLPDDLRPSLDARLSTFVQAQNDGKWELVASMLGRYRRGGAGDHLYTPQQKACPVSQTRAFPMISFTDPRVRFSTEILSMPAGRRWWFLSGEAVFGGKSPGKRSTTVVAYRHEGEWYFTPPNFDDYWARTQIAETDLATDHGNEVEVERTPDSPLEVLDLRVFIDKGEPSIRDVKFKLRNRTVKKVTAFVINIYSNADGSTGLSMGQNIDPGGVLEVNTSSSRYVYFCDGVNKDRVVVDSVSFADGSEWHSRKPD